MMIWIIRKKRREKEDEGNKDGFDWEAMIDEAVVEGNTARERSFMMLRIRIEVLREVRRDSTTALRSSARRRNKWSPFLMCLEELEFVNTSRRYGKSQVIKKGEEPKKYDFFEDTFLTMCKLTREDGIWWIGSGENRRRDDDEAAPEEEAEGNDEGNKDDFDWEAVIDEATVEGESESDDQFYDAQVGEEEPVTETPAAPAVPASSSAQQKDQEPAGVDPSGLTGRDA
ncbi:hypothetical protein Dimus_017728 [Dionaea muscipula]